MSRWGPPPGSAINETAPHRPEAWLWSPWPMVAGLATPFLAWGFVAWRPMLLVGVVLALVALGGWLRDIARGHDAEGARAHPGSLFTTHVALSGALVLVTALFYAAAVRALVAHGLLRPENWPAAGQEQVTAGSVGATAALVLAMVAAWASWRRPARGVALAGTAVAFVVLHFGALALHVRGLVDAGFMPQSGPAGSLYYWILGLHTVFAVGGTTALTVTAAFRKQEPGPATAAALFFAWMVLAWLLVFALVHLHALPLPGRRLAFLPG